MHGQIIVVKDLLAKAGFIQYMVNEGSKASTCIQEAKSPLPFERRYKCWQDIPYCNWFCELLGYEVLVFVYDWAVMFFNLLKSAVRVRWTHGRPRAPQVFFRFGSFPHISKTHLLAKRCLVNA